MQLINFQALFPKRAAAILFCCVIFFSSCIDDHELEFNPDLDIPPSCSDGLKNGDETAIDCGGACMDFCGEEILAQCTEELEPNKVISEDIDHSISFTNVSVAEDFNDNGYSRIRAIDPQTMDEVIVLLPFASFPAGNVKFFVGENVITRDGNQAKVEVVLDDYYYSRISVGGEVYVRVEESKIHIEFCEMRFESNDSWENYIYVYSGNLNFQKTDINKQ